MHAAGWRRKGGRGRTASARAAETEAPGPAGVGDPAPQRAGGRRLLARSDRAPLRRPPAAARSGGPGRRDNAARLEVGDHLPRRRGSGPARGARRACRRYVGAAREGSGCAPPPPSPLRRAAAAQGQSGCHGRGAIGRGGAGLRAAHLGGARLGGLGVGLQQDLCAAAPRHSPRYPPTPPRRPPPGPQDPSGPPGRPGDLCDWGPARPPQAAGDATRSGSLACPSRTRGT